MGGLEVEDMAPVAAEFTGIVVGLVKSVKPHPDADKLRVTEVDAGTGELLQIVCGAPNVAEGQKVPCALVGARLPGLAIKKAKLRGVESSGMLCSARELGLSEDHGGLLVLEDDAPVGRDIREHLGLDDTILTLKLTPNRGDCLSMLGIARDVAAITGARLTLPPAEPVAVKGTAQRVVSIAVPKACGAYFGRVIGGLDPSARTPAWMVRRLERAGHRAISPLVDITHYVMLERGQPMHAFDDAKLQGPIGVRDLEAGEKVQLLNGQWVEHRTALLAITDGSGPVALGGVMGGLPTMVGEATTSVFFEAAFFHPAAVQGRAKALELTSDAAYRYERGVDFGGTRAALERATELTLAICGGEAGPVTHASGELPARPAVRVRPPRVRALLGYDVADGTMQDILARLACGVAKEGDAFAVTPPTWRFDLAIEEDFVEEIARIHGYDHVPSAPPRARSPMLAPPEGARTRFALRRAVAALGYQEVVNYSFVPETWERDFVANEAPVRLANPIASTMTVMRTTLLGGLVATLVANRNRGEDRIRIFEIGRCFEGEKADLGVQPERIAGLAGGTRRPEQWAEKGEPVDFFDVKGDLEAIAGRTALTFRAGAHPACHPGRCALVFSGESRIGFVGELHPRLQQQYELETAPVAFELLTGPLLEGVGPRFAGLSRMPVVRRDIAVTVPDEVPVGDILGVVSAGLPPWVREVAVFDQYRGKGVEAGRKSLAFRILMQDTDRTLTDAVVEEVVTSIRDQLIKKFKAQPRT